MITGIPGKTGIVYTLDRKTGEFLWARPTVFQNVSEHRRRDRARSPVEPRSDVQRASDQSAGLPGHERRQELAGRRVQPADQRDVHAAAEHVHERDDATTDQRDPEARLRLQRPNTSSRRARTKVGIVWAISAETGKTLWKHEQRAGVMSLVATGGGLVFGGDVEGTFQALDDTTGKVLWETNLGSPVSGYPITYRRRRQAVRRGHDRPVARRGDIARVTPELAADSAARRSRVRAAVAESSRRRSCAPSLHPPCAAGSRRCC